MSFVNPLLLAGTTLIAIPIVLHLIMRRKPRHIEFPAIRFLRKRHDVNRRQVRLRHLLLLALRALAILLLAVALARPSVKLSGSLGSQEAPVAAVLVFDTSMRMDYEHQNRTRLDVAREMGLWLLAQFPPESEIAVLDTGPGPVAFQVDRGAAKHRIERLTTTANSQPLSARLAAASRLLLESDLARREVYLLTDMALASWPGPAAAQVRDRLAGMPEVGIYVVDVGVEEPVNSALGELRLSEQVLSSRSPLRIETEISHRGPEAERSVELHLLEGDPEAPGGGRRPQRLGQKSVKLAPGQTQQIGFEIGPRQVGTHQGYVQIVGQDGLSCDDRRFFTVEVKPAWRILIAGAKPPEQSARFASQMLAPKLLVRSGAARFDCQVVAMEDLAEHALEPYSAVFLVDPTPLAPAVWEKLGDFVSNGHGVALFLGRRAKPVEPLNRSVAQQLLPGKLLREARRPEGDVHLAPDDFQHPILAAFRTYAGSIPWPNLPVFRYWQLDDPAPGVDVVVRFNDGEPAILDRPLGNGHVLTMTTPISGDPDSRRDPWNVLAQSGDQSWPCFMLVNEIASYLVGSGNQQLNYFAGQTALLRLDPQWSFPSYVLTAPNVLDDVAVRLAADLRQHVLVVASTEELGNYNVHAGGSDSGVELGFSVNLASEQTRLERISEEELADVFGPLPYRVARNRNQLEGDRSMQRVGRELFALLILMVALALSAEHLLANRFYKE